MQRASIYRSPPQLIASKCESSALGVEAVSWQVEGEELRYDVEDGKAYPRTSFIEVYGYEEGMIAWKTARVARPAAGMNPAGSGLTDAVPSACLLYTS